MYCRLIIMIAFYHSFIKINRYIIHYLCFIFWYIFWDIMSKVIVCTTASELYAIRQSISISFYKYCRLIIIIAFYHSFIKINIHFYFFILFYFFIYFLGKNVQSNSLPNSIRILLLDRPSPCHSICIVG